MSSDLRLSSDRFGSAPARLDVGLPGPDDVRRARRETADPVLGGVAAGLARHLGWSVLSVRVAFVVTAGLGGLGAVYYALLWLMLPARRDPEEAPGLGAARRTGRRPGRLRRLAGAGPVVVLAVLGIGLVLVVQALTGAGAVVWPLALAAAGTALLWRQADEAQRERWADASGRVGPARVLLGRGGWAAWARLLVGALLVAVAVVLFSVRGGSLTMVRDLVVAALLGVIGIGVVIGPWVVRLVAELGEERAERVRTQERSDVAAHLHDSVLQTLALIQNNAADPAAVSRLARAQERDLRTWLFDPPAADGSSLAGALRALAAEVEDAHAVVVDVVAVGDRVCDDRVRPVVAATREAVANAARHAGVARVDVYLEVDGPQVEVFVRDRGRGFDPAAVPVDRHGVRRSIVDRLERHGGSAEIRTAPGEGTEVRLRLDAGGAR